MIDIKNLNLKINRYVDSLFVGNYKTAFKWRWIEFSDYRLYDSSDDAKYIDFLASAREGKLLIKRFTEERELTVFFILDVSESMHYGFQVSKLQTLLETFYGLAFSAQKNNDKIWALIFNDIWYELIKPWKWIKNIHKILQILSVWKFNEKKDFDVNALLRFFNNLPIKNSLVFFLTDKMDEIDDKNLKIASIKNDFVFINIFDYIENNLLSGDGVLQVWNTDGYMYIDLTQTHKVTEFQKLREQKINFFKAKLNKYKISYLLFDDKTNIFAQLLTFFKNR